MTQTETIKIIEKLIELTQHKKLTWSYYNSNITLASHERYESAYSTEYLNKSLRIYKYSYQYWIDEDTYHWIYDTRFEFYDKASGVTLYIFPKVTNTDELLTTIMYQNSGVDSFYSQMFKQ